jgi:hypothetical protein
VDNKSNYEKKEREREKEGENEAGKTVKSMPIT